MKKLGQINGLTFALGTLLLLASCVDSTSNSPIDTGTGTDTTTDTNTGTNSNGNSLTNFIDNLTTVVNNFLDRPNTTTDSGSGSNDQASDTTLPTTWSERTDSLRSLGTLHPPMIARKSWNSGINNIYEKIRIKDIIGSPAHQVLDQIVLEGSSISLSARFFYMFPSLPMPSDLEKESVHIFISNNDYNGWEDLGVYTSDDEGRVALTIPPRPEGLYRLEMIVQGDLSRTYGYVTVVRPDQKATLFDIDGTITTSDLQQFPDYIDFKIASTYENAADVVDFYLKNKNQLIILMTGRPYVFSSDTREFLRAKHIPDTTLIQPKNISSAIPGSPTQQYKTEELISLIQDKQLDITDTYGNATTDIGAYQAVGIANDHIWIIGPNAGVLGTTPISCIIPDPAGDDDDYNCGFREHYIWLQENYL